MELLSILYRIERLKNSRARNYKRAFISTSFSEFSMGLKSAVFNETLIEELQKRCAHPLGVKAGLKVYCPICEKELSPDSVITIEKEAGKHNIGFIREKISEVLPLIPEVTPAQMAEYVDRELKTIER